MDQWTKRGKYGVWSENIASCLKAMINVVLDCLHIVAGLGFNLGKFGNGIRVEILRKCTQVVQFGIRNFGCVSDDAPSQQLNHPLDLDKNSGSIERSFRKVLSQFLGLRAVATVQWRQRLVSFC